MTGRAGQTDRTRRSRNTASPQSNDQTRPSEGPDTTVPASGLSPVSSLNDRTHPIVRDRTRPASDHHSAALCPSERMTGRAGPVKDRTRRSRAVLLRTGELTGRAGQARPASGHSP
jgi:hypothetical protein